MSEAPLTGFWDGTYRYDLRGSRRVSFDAELADDEGHLSGLITEPNSFVPDGPPVLGADLDGWAEGRRVQFTKTYHPAAGGHAVRYEGAVSERGLLITGEWRIGGLTGTFQMRRDPGLLTARSTARTARALVPVSAGRRRSED